MGFGIAKVHLGFLTELMKLPATDEVTQVLPPGFNDLRRGFVNLVVTSPLLPELPKGMEAPEILATYRTSPDGKVKFAGYQFVDEKQEAAIAQAPPSRRAEFLDPEGDNDNDDDDDDDDDDDGGTAPLKPRRPELT